jgi:hypothetical protein
LRDKAKAGTLFIREGTILPGPLQLETEPYIRGWRLVKYFDGHGLGREIGGAGWTFFCIAGDIQATAFGHAARDGVSRAVRGILEKLKPAEFNSLEITEVVSKHFLGVPCVNVHARSRHIQESMFLFRAQGVKEWRQAMLAAA